MTKLLAGSMLYGLVYQNPTPAWISAPLLVLIQGSTEWRFTVDLRPVNQIAKRNQFPIHVLEQELTKITKTKVYAHFDFVHGYWQLSIARESQASQSFMILNGLYSPTCVPHRPTNAVTHLQSSLKLTLPRELMCNLLLRLDD